MRTIATMMIMVLAAALLVACTGTAPETRDGTSLGEQGATAENNVEKAPAEDAKETSAPKEFLDFMAGKTNLEWKIAYDLTTTVDGETTKSTMTQYMKTEKKFRFDSTYDGIESQMFMVNDVLTACTKMDGKWSCFKITSDKEEESTPSNVKFEESFEENPDDYSIVSDGTKQVAGVTAKCFKVVEKTQDAVVRYCIKDNLPLYIYSAYEGTTSEMIATSYSKSVPDSAFTPPAEAKDLSEMMGGFGGASGTGPSGDMCAVCDYLSGADKEDCLANC